MRFATIEVDGSESPCVWAVDGWVGLDKFGFSSVLDLIEAGAPARDAVRENLKEAQAEHAGSDLRFLPPIPHPPRNIFCVGANYRQHIAEGVRRSDQTLPAHPVYFTKPFTTLRGHGATVEFPAGVASMLDWEAEIAVVIGKAGRSIPIGDAPGHIFGYTLANDLSARDLQMRSGGWGQWFKGKSLDGSCPIGPYISTFDDVGTEVPDIEFSLTVNGIQKQSSRTSEMIHSVATIVSDLSLGMELLPGDIILTGTCEGVGYWQNPQEFLETGDEVVISSPQLGELSTSLVIG